jgi:hypothetical protein
MRLGILSLAFVALAALPAAAEQGQPAGDDDPRLDEIEEQVLRTQVETILNDVAHWDREKHRIVIDRRGSDEGRPGELGPLEPIGEMILGRTIEPDEHGRLRIKSTVKLRPFARVAQDFIAEGGAEDIEAFQRFRNGQGENPFKKGIPPRVQKAIAGTLKALNDQNLGLLGGGGGEKRAPVKVAKKRDDGDGERDEGARPEREERRQGEERQVRVRILDRVRERMDVSPEEMEAFERYARDLADQVERDIERYREQLEQRWEEFSNTPRGQEFQDRAMRLRQRAEDELRRALESEDMQKRLEAAQRRAMEFLASPEGQEMQRRFMEFLNGENGREIRRRLEEFMSSERGQDLLRRLAERFRGQEPRRPDRREGAREDRSRAREDGERGRERTQEDDRRGREGRDGGRRRGRQEF